MGYRRAILREVVLAARAVRPRDAARLVVIARLRAGAGFRTIRFRT